jgi:glycosyltransferase involved in cell wall biosynthesis
MRKSGEIVILGMFDLARLDSARAVRIHNLHLSLRALAPVTLLAGNRSPRRWAVLRYLLRGGLRRTRAVYVEASNGPATEIELLFLALARTAGIPVIIYIPDAYQLFPDIFPRGIGLKTKLLEWGWRCSIAVYLRLANLLLFPSLGLAECFNSRQAVDVLLPAGQCQQELVPQAWESPTVVYVGAATFNDGSDLLLSAMEQVVAQYPKARCHFISSIIEGNILAKHPAYHAPWLTVEQRASDELAAVMISATLAIIPARVNPYNDLRMPIKLFDYMSFGRPVVVTRCRDMAALVNELEVGLVVDDTVDGLAQGIIRLLKDCDLATRLSQNGYRASQTAQAWPHRAGQLLQMIEKIEGERGEQ